jgi:hypothetical protein
MLGFETIVVALRLVVDGNYVGRGTALWISKKVLLQSLKLIGRWRIA